MGDPFRTEEIIGLTEAVKARVPSTYVILRVSSHDQNRRSHKNIVLLLNKRLVEVLKPTTTTRMALTAEEALELQKAAIQLYKHYHLHDVINPLEYLWLFLALVFFPESLLNARSWPATPVGFFRDVLSRFLRELIQKLEVNIMSITNSNIQNNLMSWWTGYLSSLKTDKERLLVIEQELNQLKQQYVHLNHGTGPILDEPQLVDSLVKFRPVSRDSQEVIDASDGLHIFEMAKPSLYIPFVKYHNGTDILYKINERVMTPLEEHKRAFYERFIHPKGEKRIKPHYLVFTIWLGDPEHLGLPADSAPANTIISVSYKLPQGVMSVKLERGGENRITTIDAVRRRIEDAFPNIDLSSYQVAGYRGSFNIYGFKLYPVSEFDRGVFTNMALNDPLFNQYFYLNDRIHPVYGHEGWTLRYRAHEVKQRLADEVGIKIKLQPYLLSQELTIRPFTIEGLLGAQRLPAETIYLHVEITKAIRQQTFTRIMVLLQTLLYYQTSQPLPVGAHLVADYNLVNVFSYRDQQSEEFSYKNYPNILPSNYHQLCVHPPVITKSGYPAYYPDNSGGYNIYPVTPFPAKAPVVDLRSDDPSRPYVRIISRGGSSYPCCSETPEPTGRATEPRSIVEFGVVGVLFPLISSSLLKIIDQTYNGNVRTVLFAKAGLPRVRNSIFQAVHLALASALDREKMSERLLLAGATADWQQATNFTKVQDDWVTLSKSGRPLYLSALAQQTFGYEQAAIVSLMKSSQRLSVNIFWRLIEEFYDIQLVVFSSSNHQTDPTLTVPRYAHYYTYRQSNRPVVVVLSHFGTRQTPSPTPHYELVVLQRTVVGQETGLLSGVELSQFSPEFGTVLLDESVAPHRQLVWMPQLDNEKLLRAYSNPTIRLDYQDHYQLRLVGQDIDDLGKAIMLNFTHELGQSFLVVAGVMPYNVPRQAPTRVTLTVTAATTIFGSPRSADYRDKLAVGLWFNNPTVPDDQFYVGVVPTSATLPKGQYQHYRYHTKRLIYQDFLRAERTHHLVLTLLRWLFLIAYHNDSGLTVEGFWKQYILVRPSKEDSPYVIEAFSSRLPRRTTVASALSWLLEQDTHFSNDGRHFLLYSQSYATKLMQELAYYSQILALGEEQKLTRINIAGWYVATEDKRYNQVLAFGTKAAFEQWQLAHRSHVGSIVHTAINIELTERHEPYIYTQTVNNRSVYFLIQNVFDKNQLVALQRAIYLGHYWESTHTIETNYLHFHYEFDAPDNYIKLMAGTGAFVSSKENTYTVPKFEEELRLEDPEHYAGLTAAERATEVTSRKETFMKTLPCVLFYSESSENGGASLAAALRLPALEV